MQWTESELKLGKLIKIKNFPADKKVKLFRVTVFTNRTEYVVTNDLSQSDTNDVRKVCSQGWKIEEFHRELKQLTGIEACQCRKARIQKNHIICAFLVWSFLKKTARLMGKNIYQLKSKLLADYLKKELKYPKIRLTFV